MCDNTCDLCETLSDGDPIAEIFIQNREDDMCPFCGAPLTEEEENSQVCSPCNVG